MPKQILEINPFHSGLNNNADPRDIKMDELSLSRDIMVDEIGKVRTMGKNISHDSASKSVTLQAGYGLFSFSHDKLGAQDASSSQSATGDNYLALANADTGADIEIYSNSDDSWSSSSRIVMGDGSSTSGLLAVFYIADGNLRVGDASLASDKRPQWYGYIDRYFYGDGTSGLSSGNHSNGARVDKWHTQDSSPDSLTPSVAVGGTITSGQLPTASKPIGLILSGRPKEYLDLTSSGSATTNTDRIQWNTEFDVSDNKLKGRSATNDDIEMANFVSVGDKILLNGTAGNATFNGVSVDGQILTVKTVGTGSTNNMVFEESIGGSDNTNDDVYITNLSRSAWFDSTDPGFEIAYSTIYDNPKQESILEKLIFTGTHTGSDNASTLTDSAATFPVDGLIGFKIKNLTDGSEALITDNDGTTITGALADGSGNDWDTDDKYEISVFMPFNKIHNDATSGFYSMKFIFLIYAHETDGLHISHPRVSGFKIYMKRENSPNWYLQSELDITKGARTIGQGKYAQFEAAYVLDEVAGSTTEKVTSFRQIETYESETGYTPETINIGFNTNGLGYKTGIIANRRAYVGNVKIKDQFGTTHTLPDTILKSPVNKFDSFVYEDRIEATVNDGSSIVKLEEYADRLLEFKEDKMTLINISQSIEFLEEVFMHKGVIVPGSVCKTDYGIAWVNENGCYLYDGKNVRDLLEKRGEQIINEKSWRDFLGGKPLIGYVPKKRQLIVVSSSGTATDGSSLFLYDMVTQSWTQGYRKFNEGVKKTNFVTDWNNDLVIAHTSGTVVKWDDTSSTTSNLQFAIKDLTFGQPGQRKKLHKVYISYRGDASALNCYFAGNGESDSSDWHQFNSTNTPLDNKDSDEEMEKWHLGELIPTNSNEANNLYSVRFVMQGTADEKFEINDVNVVFRMKNVK
tara:strand:- start:14763 stop:17507 length:2745 start_codon:yes stop_codon:yes gene_type:complete